MKMRQGFVSNSSSSSFIIGMGVVNDRDKFDNWVKNNNIDVDTCLASKLNDNWGGPNVSGRVLSMDRGNAYLSVDISKAQGFEGEAHEVAKKLLTDDTDPLIMWFNAYGEEPDGENYDDVDLSYFSDCDVDVYEGLENGTVPGVGYSSADYGGWYNG